MIKLKDLIVERIDYLDTANQIIKAYRVQSKVKFTSGSNIAEYDWIRDIINLRKSYSTTKDFIISVLHEIHHAIQRKKVGAKKYEKLYVMAGELAQQKGGDFYKDNPYEKKAERWAKSEAQIWVYNIIIIGVINWI